eukprot:COSAG02_NODE_4442_length_5352_cov_91.216638_4_plen_135_part_00
MPQPSLQGHSAIYFERGVEPTLPIDLYRSVHGDRARDAQSNDPSQKVLACDRIALLVDIRTQCIAGLQNTASRLDKQYASERRLADDLKPGVDRCWINLDGINLKTLALKKEDQFGSPPRRQLNCVSLCVLLVV